MAGAVWEAGTLGESYACSNERMEGEEYRGGNEEEQGGVGTWNGRKDSKTLFLRSFVNVFELYAVKRF